MVRHNDDIQKDAIESSIFQQNTIKLLEARNYHVKKTSSNFRKSYQLSVAISKLQGLTNVLRVCNYINSEMCNDFCRYLLNFVLL